MEMKKRHWVCKPLRDKKKVERISINGAEQVNKVMWFGHLERRHEYHVNKIAGKRGNENKREKVRLKLRWRDQTKMDLREKFWKREEVIDGKLWSLYREDSDLKQLGRNAKWKKKKIVCVILHRLVFNFAQSDSFKNLDQDH